MQFKPSLVRRAVGMVLLSFASACGGGDAATGPGSDGATLTSGTPVSGIAGTEDSQKFYRVTVPTGATRLLITTSGGTGDVDLYVRFGSAPTSTAVDCSSEGGDNTESCEITNPAAGQWHILLMGFEAFSGLTLTATVTGGTTPPTTGGGAWQSITAGSYHTCGLTTAGKAYCWGDPQNDAVLGDAAGTQWSLTPVAVAGNITWSALFAAGANNCGLDATGKAYCWSGNFSGQVGDGTTTPRLTPTAVATTATFARLFVGPGHVCGLTSAKVAHCWGENNMGQLGQGDRTDRPTPVAIAGYTWNDLAVNGSFTCGITTTGQTYCWGDNYQGQLTGTDPFKPALVPVRIDGDIGFSRIFAGGSHACAITAAGAGYCWGATALGRGGDGSTYNGSRYVPTAMTGGVNWATMSVSSSWNVCGLNTAGKAYCWGPYNDHNNGDGSTSNLLSPTQVQTGMTFTSISAGGLHTCGMSSGGAVCWGSNEEGQLGRGTGPNRPTAMVVPAP